MHTMTCKLWHLYIPVASRSLSMHYPVPIGFHLSESYRAYAFAVTCLLKWTPKRLPVTIEVVFADCFLTLKALRECGLRNCKLFYDHWHLHAVVFPKVRMPLNGLVCIKYLLVQHVYTCQCHLVCDRIAVNE